MKKMFAALLSLCLMLSCIAAFAEAPAEVIDWSDYEAKAANEEGGFAEIGNTGLKMFVPARFQDTELSKETLESGIFMVLKPEGENAVVNAQVVPMDIDSFRATLEKQGVTLWDVTVNGIRFTYFSVETNGAMTYSFALPTEENTTLVFGFAAEDMEAYADLFKLMAASLQAAD